jgi:hypothetical protein
MLKFILGKDGDQLDLLLDESGWQDLKRVVESAFQSNDHQHMFDRRWGVQEAVLDVNEDPPTSLSKVTIYPMTKLK